MNDQQAAALAVLTKLNLMMKGSHFDICTIDAAMKALSCIPDGAAYAILRTLHCVNWGDMPAELRATVPGLIERCLSLPAYQFTLTSVSPEEQAAVRLATAKNLTRLQ